MRILQIGPIPPEAGGKTVGGVATHVWDLSIHLAKRGHEVAILADNFSNPPEVPVIKEKVKIYGLSKTILLKRLPFILFNLFTIYNLKKYLKGLIGLRRITTNFCYYNYVLRHFGPDVVHVHHLESRFSFAYFISKGKFPIVTTIHSFHSIKFSSLARSKLYHNLVANNLKLSKNIIFVSKTLEKEGKKFFGDYKANSWVINNPIDVTIYHQIDKKEAQKEIGEPLEIPILLFVGNLVKRNGIRARANQENISCQ